MLGSDAHNCSFLGNGYDCIRKNLPLELEIAYIETPKKYYFSDLGIRNARINFRQFEQTPSMERKM